MYKISDPIDQGAAQNLLDYDELTRTLLFLRGISTKEEADKFFNNEYSLKDPFLLSGMEEAVNIFLKTIDEGKKIGIYHDFDCDGIPGSAVFVSFLRKINYKNFVTYMNDRNSAGHGLTKEGIDKLLEENVYLLLTIDLGTSCIEAVNYAKEKGMTIIITDHHLPKEELPKADVILNPKVCKVYQDQLCGTGVIFKFIQGVIKGREGIVPTGWEKWLLDLVCVATVADCVPLLGENRTLVKYGLVVLNKTRRPGLRHLLEKNGIRSNANEQDISFKVAPNVNSASRMGKAVKALELFLTEDQKQAIDIVDEINKINSSRKTKVASMTKMANKLVDGRERDVLVVGNPNWNNALLGLVAQNLSKKMNNTVFAWAKDNNGVIRGSARTATNGDIVSLMKDVDIFREYGGHKGAGGFEIDFDNLDILENKLNENIDESFKNSTKGYDVEITIKDINQSFFDVLSKFSPFGHGNKNPIFKISNVVIDSVNKLGRSNSHFKYRVKESLMFLDVLSFFDELSLKKGDEVTLYGSFNKDSFSNKFKFIVEDIVK